MSDSDKWAFAYVWIGFWLCVPGLIATGWPLWRVARYVTRSDNLRAALKWLALAATSAVGLWMFWRGIELRVAA
ncbi:hypothetical protein [Mycolicibacterium litorale]|uniref:hypothetical protein n=1 Tax=Mycolicibacterium litorale TaxID=758802 RepID=UPI00162A027F|nr:hypothetical protein [Mycolicibacterium litorale]